MRYSVFVVTATQFMVDVYGRLMGGDELGESGELRAQAA